MYGVGAAAAPVTGAKTKTKSQRSGGTRELGSKCIHAIYGVVGGAGV